jgi:hypothetical protein
LLIVLSACLPIPHRHTVQAGGSFHVTDQRNRPLAGAMVYVYEGSIIGGSLGQQAEAKADSVGMATIPRERSWHLLLVFVPDAEAPSVFGWCAEAPGYAPLIGEMEDEAEHTLEVSLEPAVEESHCPPELDGYKLESGGYESRPAV